VLGYFCVILSHDHVFVQTMANNFEVQTAAWSDGFLHGIMCLIAISNYSLLVLCSLNKWQDNDKFHGCLFASQQGHHFTMSAFISKEDSVAPLLYGINPYFSYQAYHLPTWRMQRQAWC
jgi:hypothetical protein